MEIAGNNDIDKSSHLCLPGIETINFKGLKDQIQVGVVDLHSVKNMSRPSSPGCESRFGGGDYSVKQGPSNTSMFKNNRLRNANISMARANESFHSKKSLHGRSVRSKKQRSNYYPAASLMSEELDQQ